MSKAQELVDAVEQAQENRDEYFGPHVQRKIKHEVELGSIPAHRQNVMLDYDEDRSYDGHYVFYHPGDDYWHHEPVQVVLTDKFIEDAEAADEIHQKALKAREAQKIALRKLETANEIRSLERQLERKREELNEV